MVQVASNITARRMKIINILFSLSSLVTKSLFWSKCFTSPVIHSFFPSVLFSFPCTNLAKTLLLFASVWNRILLWNCWYQWTLHCVWDPTKKDSERCMFIHCWKEIGDFQIICSKVGGFRPFNYLLGVRCYLLSLKCKWLVLNKLCNFTAYKLFVSTNKQLSDPMDSMADPLFSSYSAHEQALFAHRRLFWKQGKLTYRVSKRHCP